MGDKHSCFIAKSTQDALLEEVMGDMAVNGGCENRKGGQTVPCFVLA